MIGSAASKLATVIQTPSMSVFVYLIIRKEGVDDMSLNRIRNLKGEVVKVPVIIRPDLGKFGYFLFMG